MQIKRRRRNRVISRKTELRLKIGFLVIACLTGIGLGIGYFMNSTIYSLAAVTKVSLVGYDSKGYVKAEIDSSELTEEEVALKQVLETV